MPAPARAGRWRRRCACSSPRAARASRSTACATSATARPGGWASRSPTRPRARGADVTVVAANVALPAPAGACATSTSSTRRRAAGAPAREAFAALRRAADGGRRRRLPPARRRRRRSSRRTAATGSTLALEPTPDVLAALAAARRARPDAGRLRRRARRRTRSSTAREKLAAQGPRRDRRQRHLAAGHRLRRADNEVTIVTARRRARTSPRAAKAEVARAILDAVDGAARGRGEGGPRRERPRPARRRVADLADERDAAMALRRRIAEAVDRAVEVRRDLLDDLLVCVVAEGHVLHRGPARAWARRRSPARSRASLDLQFARVQCTADLLPADVVGTNVFNQREDRFEFRPGPIFANVVLVDEINRASPKTQSGLLECMQERRVTVDVHTHELARPFLVLATQNPVEFEGTYPLPEAQVDRFMCRAVARLPVGRGRGRHAPRARDGRPRRGDRAGRRPPPTLLAAQDAALRVHASDALRTYVVALLHRTRAGPARRARRQPAGRPDAAARRQGARAAAGPRPRAARRRAGAGRGRARRTGSCSRPRRTTRPASRSSPTRWRRRRRSSAAPWRDPARRRDRRCWRSSCCSPRRVFDAEPLYVPGAAFLALAAGRGGLGRRRRARRARHARGRRAARARGAARRRRARVRAGAGALPTGVLDDPLLQPRRAAGARRRRTRHPHRGALRAPRAQGAARRRASSCATRSGSVAHRRCAAADADEVLVLPRVEPVRRARGRRRRRRPRRRRGGRPSPPRSTSTGCARARRARRPRASSGRRWPRGGELHGAPAARRGRHAPARRARPARAPRPRRTSTRRSARPPRSRAPGARRRLRAAAARRPAPVGPRRHARRLAARSTCAWRCVEPGARPVARRRSPAAAGPCSTSPRAGAPPRRRARWRHGARRRAASWSCRARWPAGAPSFAVAGCTATTLVERARRPRRGGGRDGHVSAAPPAPPPGSRAPARRLRSRRRRGRLLVRLAAFVALALFGPATGRRRPGRPGRAAGPCSPAWRPPSVLARAARPRGAPPRGGARPARPSCWRSCSSVSARLRACARPSLCAGRAGASCGPASSQGLDADAAASRVPYRGVDAWIRIVDPGRRHAAARRGWRRCCAVLAARRGARRGWPAGRRRRARRRSTRSRWSSPAPRSRSWAARSSRSCWRLFLWLERLRRRARRRRRGDPRAAPPSSGWSPRRCWTASARGSTTRALADDLQPRARPTPSTGTTATRRWTGRATGARCCASTAPDLDATGRRRASTISTACAGARGRTGFLQQDETEAARLHPEWLQTMTVTLRNMDSRALHHRRLGAAHPALRTATGRAAPTATRS